MSYAEKLLTDILTAQGVDPVTAARAAKTILVAEVAAGIATATALEVVDRDAHVYGLRGKGLSCTVIGERISIRRERVVEAIRRHAGRRRATLRVMAA